MADVNLPVWVEYVKALSTPIVALIAACIAGGIAYQQWRTARNKLKLDLFEKRMKVYDACLGLLRLINMPIRTDYDTVLELVSAINGHQWLFGQKVTAHIEHLMERSEEIYKKKKLEGEGLDDSQKIKIALGFYEMTKESYLKDVEVLNAVFAPYMKLEH